MRILIAAAVLLLTGCPAEPEIVEFVNEGALCLSNGDLVVDWQTCLSSSCDTLTDDTCTATLTSGTLVVESYGRIESDVAAGTCTSDCGFASATCTLPLIEDPATVTVEHGSTSTLLGDIPDCEL